MGEDGPGGRAEVGPGLTEPPIGRVYGRRRGRRLAVRKSTLLETRLDAVAALLPDAEHALDPFAWFEPQPRAVWLEIGFGGGEHLAAQAARHPEIGFIGCEPFLNGVSNLLLLLETGGQGNVRILADDARLLLQALRPGAIDRVFLLFPDPWPKRRHESRRFLAPGGLALLARALADGGVLRAATDHAGLGAWMIEQVEAHRDFALGPIARERPADWVPTRYEGKALRAGRQPVYFEAVRRPRGATET